MDKQLKNELLLQLSKVTTGANAHTAGKASFYLNKFSESGKFLKGLNDFVDLIRGALYRNEWKALDDRMAKWW